MLIAFHTLGCKVNQYETQAMRRILEQAGYQTAEFGNTEALPDVLVINSCTVTGESDRKLRQFLRRCRRQVPEGILVLTGCMPQAYPEKAAALEEADLVLGNAARRDILPRLEQYLANRQRVVDISQHEKIYEPLDIDEFQGRTRAFIKIQDGCNRFCTYCIIPYARGRVRSRRPEDITAELERLAAKGYKEVVLVGINLTAYGQDNGLTIADAVDAACRVEGIERVRLGSLEPDFITDETIARMKAQPKLCPQFHLALQSGCDATLKRMNRHYTTAEYADLCRRLRQHFPGCALTTDVMVGFPGETQEEFEASCRFVEEMAFSRVHVFAYSRRPGTIADRLPGQVDTAEKARRSKQMIAVCRQTAETYAERYIGTTVPILLETPYPDGSIDGHTDTYQTVRVKSDRPSGSIVNVKILSRKGDELYGEETL
ncbi:MAG: tRNA (N(6)-L-threonylcarbamoyladenosine(37)-C(2))-methylthiotransferase MtaB [Ruminococcaceae bacterium]|nr:tRNA (N(6)-L-threonylcarbamoyladenosine(37)-C(2))-methylthiotransferase MtaB [Oscillospiraceae bacterium]